jgi:hypothetical protein
VKGEVLFHYEHGSNYRVADTTFDKLLGEVSDEDFAPYELPGRIRCDQLQEFIEKRKPDLRTDEGKSALRAFADPAIPDVEQFVSELADFLHTKAKLPDLEKKFLPTEILRISVEQSREQIIEYLQQERQRNRTADLAFYAYRDVKSCDWAPFIKAAVERNPISIRMTESMSPEQVYQWLQKMRDISIYDGKRLAQPDEVANFQTGDGVEKAFLLANVIRERGLTEDIELVAEKDRVVLKAQGEYAFVSGKGLAMKLSISQARVQSDIDEKEPCRRE